jgi:hypothetical protein
MAKNWILDVAEKADENSGVIRIENPEKRAQIDVILLKLWDAIKNHVKGLELKLEPEIEAEIESGDTAVLLRVLSFMLFDDEEPVCRTEIECYTDHWMINNEFFLSLDETADIPIVHEILGNTRFSGNPPSMMIYKNDPENHYQITFNAGWGEDWDMQDFSFVTESILHSIDTHVNMWKIVCEGLTDTEHAEEFLSTAYEVYEAHEAEGQEL